MNQILSTENNYKQKKQKNHSELLDMRKIIIVFSVLIIIFALVILGAKLYVIIKEKKEKNNNSAVEVLNKPKIEITVIDNQCRIEIEYDEGLSEISYKWNDEEETVRMMNGSTSIKTPLEIPEGDYNKLYVKATGVDGSTNEKEQEFTLEGTDQDSTKPQILCFYEAGKVEIIAKSSKGIKNLTYQWGDEEVETINSTEENQKELTTTIDAKRGTHEIYITATDIEGNIQEKSVPIQGVLIPEINLKIENPNLLKINIKHDMGFKKVTIKINGQEQVYDENSPQYSEEITELNVNLEVPPGQLEVEVSVYTLEEPDKEYTRKGHQQIPE